MHHLRKRLLPLLRAAFHPSPAPATTHDLSPSLHRSLLLSTSATGRTPFSVEEYLVGSCGLTAAQALKASKKLSHLKSASNADAVLALLSGLGLSRPDIAAVVAAEPQLLCSRVNNIAPRLVDLRSRVGMTDPQIARFLLAGGGRILHNCDVVPRIKFWIPFFGSLDRLIHILKRNNSILTAGLEKVAKPNIALLQQCGLSVSDIGKLSPYSRLVVFNPEQVKVWVQRADKLGVPRASYAFKYTLAMVSCVDEEKVATRTEFLRTTLGCSMEKLCFELRKHPQVLAFSEDTLRRKIDFMINEVGLEPEYIVERPKLLGYSLEKRMLPRHYAIKILQKAGLVKKGVGFTKILSYGVDDFVARYIDRHKDAVPGLADTYAAACSGKMPAMAD